MQNVSDLIFAAGMALPSPSTPIAVQYDLLLLTFVFREKDGIILDAEANMVCDITSTYLRYLLVGRCIYTDVDQIIWEIEHTYLGISRQALLVCVKDAYSKICERGSWLPGLRSPSRPSTVGNVNSKCEKNIKKYNQASRANSSRHSANTISAVFQPNISRG